MKTVFEYDAKTGLNVLIRSTSTSGKDRGCMGAVTFGTKSEKSEGVALSEVLEFLRNIENPGKNGNINCSIGLPVTSGKALEVAYLSWVVGVGVGSGVVVAPAETHDLYIHTLLGVIDSHTTNTNTSEMEGIYREALQSFLQISCEYDPDTTRDLIPEHYLHEHALILSRLGEYEKVCVYRWYRW